MHLIEYGYQVPAIINPKGVLLKLRLVLFLTFIIFYQNISYSQIFPRFSLAGGPTVGWQYQNVDDINLQMRNIGVPEFPKDGFLVLGGGGFIDLPFKSVRWLRVGGSGTGFTYKRSVTTAGNISKTIFYSFGTGGTSFEYVKQFGKRIELTGGVFLSTGKLTIELFQNTNNFGNWNTIFNEIGNSSSSQNISRKLSVRFYSAQPQIGFGIFITPYMYAKLNAGYLFSTNGDWKVDNDITVSDAPSGIEADGFNFNFGLNFGLFTK